MGYSRAVRVGNVVEVSGTTAQDGDTVTGTDAYHGFPLMMNQMLIFGVVTRIGNGLAVGLDGEEEKGQERLTFVQIPQNLTRFFELTRKDKVMFVPIEEVVREFLPRLFRNVEIISADLFRITRNGLHTGRVR